MPITQVTNSGTGSTIWYNWCEDTVTSTSSTAWQKWISTATTASNVWLTWNTTATASTRRIVPYAAVELTAEQKAAEEERLKVMRKRQEAEAKRWAAEKAEKDRIKKEADDRAYKLLTEHLTEQQLADFNEFGCFNVVSLKGNNYRINKGQVGNLDALDANGKTTARLCVHPQGGVPFGDIMLAQKLLLEAGEEDMLLAKANKHGFSQPNVPVPKIRKVA
jgi:hypothetical protein